MLANLFVLVMMMGGSSQTIDQQSSALASDRSAAGGIVVTLATADTQRGVLHIEGSGFGLHPTVLLGDAGGVLSRQAVMASTGTTIDAKLSSALAGSHLLLVSFGTGVFLKTASFEVTIGGAVGATAVIRSSETYIGPGSAPRGQIEAQTVTTACQAGEIAMGGGYLWNSLVNPGTCLGSYPISDGTTWSWAVEIAIPQVGVAPGPLTVYAVCAPGPPPRM